MALLKALGLAPPSAPGALERAALLMAHLQRREAALNGAIAAARALALEPKSLAALRDQTFATREKKIAATAEAGRIRDADRLLAAWVDEADAWQEARASYEALANPKQPPDRATLARLAKARGGADVLDALVDAVPEDAPAATLAAALEARHGVRVVAPAPKPDNAAADPPTPARSAKGLYKLLGRAPASGAAPVTVERIAPGSLTGQPAPALFAALPAA